MSYFNPNAYDSNTAEDNDSLRDKEQNEINFGSAFDFNQISELIKHNGDQIKSLSEQLLSQAGESVVDSLTTLTELVQQVLQSSDYAFQYVNYLKGKQERYEDGQTQKDEELLQLVQKCRMQEEDLVLRQERIDQLTRECQNFENVLSDFIFQKNELTTQTAELRDQIKLLEQTQRQILEQTQTNELQEKQKNEIASLKTQTLLDQQTSQIDKLVLDSKEMGILLDEKVDENRLLGLRLQKMQQESTEFEKEFKKWEKSFEADQKVKIAMIDKLQCEMERLTGQLQQKEEEINKLKLQRSSSPARDSETQGMDFLQNSSQLSLTQDQSQHEQISHEDFLNQTQEFLEVQEFEKGGNFQDLLEDEGDGSEQRSEVQDPNTAMTRFASFVGEQKLSTEADLAQELFIIEQTSSETKQFSWTTITDDPGQIELRRDPEEEYFRLSVLSLKMQYNERDVDYVFQVSSSKLYRRCKKDGIPFHQWYNWIEYQLLLIDQEDKPSSEKQRQPTTRNNKIIMQDKNLSAALNRQNPGQPQQQQTGRPERETLFQKFTRKYWR